MDELVTEIKVRRGRPTGLWKCKICKKFFHKGEAHACNTPQ